MLSALARARLSLMLRVLVAAVLGMLVGASAGRAAEVGGEGSSRCPGLAAAGGSLAVLVDVSGSMADHDPGAALRGAVGDALGARLDGNGASSEVMAFSDRVVARRSVGGAVAGDGGGPGDAVDQGTGDGRAATIGAAVRGVVGVDAGSTDLAAGLGAAGGRSPAAGVVVLVTDAEPVARVGLPAGLSSSRLVVVSVGGVAPAWLRQLAATTGGAAVAVQRSTDSARVAGAVCGSPSADRAAAPVVLLSGLRDRANEVHGTRREADCDAALSLSTWCRAVVRAGHPVWVPSIGPGRRAPGGGRAVVDSTGRLRDNASRLAAWIRSRVPAAPVYVGHSMGGLVARAAVGWDGAAASGLVTVGSPHLGSFGADAYLAALAGAAACSFVCPLTGAGLLLAAAGVRARFGGAIDDLTRRRRTLVDPIAPLAADIPVAVYAGAVNRASGTIERLLARGDRIAGRVGPGGGYLLPNDGIVGVSSALGTGMLHSVRLSAPAGQARHSSRVPPSSAPVELESPDTAAFITEALGRFGLSAAVTDRAAAARVGPSGGSARRGAAVRRRLNAPLLPAVPLDDVAPGTVLPTVPEQVVSLRPIGLTCDSTVVDALPAADGLYLIDLELLGCTRAGIPAATAGVPEPLAGGGAVALGSRVAAAADGPRVVLVRRRSGAWRVTVQGVRERPRVSVGRRVIAMRSVSPRGAVPRELPLRPTSLRTYRGAIGRRVAAHGMPVVVGATGPGGAVLSAALELG